MKSIFVKLNGKGLEAVDTHVKAYTEGVTKEISDSGLPEHLKSGLPELLSPDLVTNYMVIVATLAAGVMPSAQYNLISMMAMRLALGDVGGPDDDHA